jgi:hypothetical protein
MLKRGVAENLEMVEFEGMNRQGADTAQGLEHVCFGLSGYAEDEVGTDLQVAVSGEPVHCPEEVIITVIPVEPSQAALVAGLQTEFDQAVLAALGCQPRQGWRQVVGNGIGSGGENQAEAVGILQDPVQSGEQMPGGERGAGLLLKIAEIPTKSSFEQQCLAATDLLGERVARTEARRGEAGRETEDTAAPGAVGAGVAEVEGDFANRLAVAFPAVPAEGADSVVPARSG